MRIHHATILLLFSQVVSFRVPLQSSSVSFPANSIESKYARSHEATALGMSVATDSPYQLDQSEDGSIKSNIINSSTAEKEGVEPKSFTEKAKSELEQFVVDIRSLYQDLELGGGSIRRDMNGLSFTYVAPPPDNVISGNNNQLDGNWRSQTPITYEADADWTSIHKQNTAERAKQTCFANPPPLMVYLPGLDGFGISATTQFDDLSSSFELWRMTIDKGNTKLSFSDLLNTVIKFIDDASKAHESPRQVMIVGESFGGLLACAITMALNTSPKYNINVKGMVLVNPATSFDETNWEQFVPLLTSLRYLESQEEIVDDRGNFRLLGDLQLPTPYSVSLSSACLFYPPL
jgi:pimeloyl-ACP methyl ester carboxylesterase